MPGGATPEGGVAVVLLAAGLSRRFGSPKQLHPFGGRPLVRRMAEKALASRADRVIVVLGAQGAEVAAALAGMPVELVHNPDFAAGQSTSVRRGLAAARDAAAAILFLPVDMPWLSVATLDRILEAWRETDPERRPAAVLPLYGGEPGAPVLFDRRLFAELDGLQGDQGGRAIWRRLAGAAPGDLVELPVANAGEGRDLDSPEDLPAGFAE